MDRQAALQAYIQAILPEREQYLYERALHRARPITRSMRPEERDAYLSGKAFANALYRVRRSDKVYQALTRGELALEYHQEEFERLQPLILAELRQDRAVDLEFLRSVERSRVSLKKARAALGLLEGQGPRKLLEGLAKRLAEEADARVERCIARSDLTRYAQQEERVPSVADYVLRTAFARGVPAAIVEQAFQPRSLDAMLREELHRAHPELAACGSIHTGGGRTVSDALRGEIQGAKRELCRRVRKRFPPERLRRLLAGNPSLRRLQRQADAASAKEQKLRTALVTAIPEHYRDLYPLARQLRRRFILHLGPTNSGKTYEGVGRLRGARNGIYLAPCGCWPRSSSRP